MQNYLKMTLNSAKNLLRDSEKVFNMLKWIFYAQRREKKKHPNYK